MNGLDGALAGSPIVREDVAGIVSQALPWDDLRGASVLVSGASGMLPAYVVLSLLALNDVHGTDMSITAMVRSESKARAAFGTALDRSDIRLLQQDVVQPLDGDDEFDVVVHGASPARPALHKSAPVDTFTANVIGTKNLLDGCKKDVGTFAFMSSAEVYGAQPADRELIAEEDYGPFDFLDPRACYSEGKRAAETLCSLYATQYGVRSRIARFGHIYGPGLALDDGRVQADFAADVLAGRHIQLNSDGAATRTYTYVADAVSGLFWLMMNGGELVYNVADGSGLVSIRQLAELFVAARPSKGLQLRFTNPDHSRSYSPAKAQGLSSGRLRGLGWEPRTPLAEGANRMISHLEWQHAGTRAPSE